MRIGILTQVNLVWVLYNFRVALLASFLKKLAATGDSYATGIGAGDSLASLLGVLDPASDWACSRYDYAYPYLISNDPRLGDPSGRNFQVFLLTIGVKDAELLNCLNHCGFQWSVLNWEQVGLAKTAATADSEYKRAEDNNWDSLGRGCDGQLDRTESIISGDAFSSNIDEILDAAKAKLADNGMIYHTGYGKFFGGDLLPECDPVSWATWFHKPYNIWQPRKKLAADLGKQQQNGPVTRSSSLITILTMANSEGRYCEPGVDGSTSASNTRSPPNHGELQGTLAGDLDIFAQATMTVDLDAELVQGDKSRRTTLLLQEGQPSSKPRRRTAAAGTATGLNKEPTAVSTAPAMGEVGYFGRSQRQLRPVGPVNPDNFENAADKACRAFAMKGERRDPMRFSIGWKQDCMLPGNAMQQQTYDIR
ncbi:hypothetical protein DL767_010129 [Monosporascus sp. MG133]|nr:hypothetical protein DL767_010129 [Monosporascus sp. MG133]